VKVALFCFRLYPVVGGLFVVSFVLSDFYEILWEVIVLCHGISYVPFRLLSFYC